jgi:hypothetical protein
MGTVISVLMVSVIHQKRAWPIYWCLLGKDGSSNLTEQQKVLRPVIRLLKKHKLVIIGDREFHQFCSKKMGEGYFG